MKRLMGLALGCTLATGCGDDESSSDSTAGSTGSTSTPGTSDSSTTAAGTSGSTTSSPGTTSTSSTDPSTTSSSSSTTDDDGTSSGTGTTGSTQIAFAQIQVDLEAQGCLTGGPCHTNPQRNVVLVENPDPAQLMQNWQNIIDAPAVPWVTPPDDSAQMLNEVPIPDDVRARWLEWIQAGAPFD